MENARRNIHGNFATKLCRMKMVTLFIDGGKSLKEKGAKSKSKVYGSTIDGSFHIAHIFPNVTKPISMSKYARVSVHSNTFSNMFTRAAIEPLPYWKMKSTKFKIMSTHVIYLLPKQSGVYLVSNCITDFQPFKGYKFIFPINKPSHSTTIQT